MRHQKSRSRNGAGRRKSKINLVVSDIPGRVQSQLVITTVAGQDGNIDVIVADQKGEPVDPLRALMMMRIAFSVLESQWITEREKYAQPDIVIAPANAFPLPTG